MVLLQQRSLKACDLLILYKATDCLTNREGKEGRGERGSYGRPIRISIKRLLSCTGKETGARVVKNVHV